MDKASSANESSVKEDEFIKEKTKRFLEKIRVQDEKQLVHATLITVNSETKAQGIYFLKKDDEQLQVKDSWMAHAVDFNGETQIRVGKIGKKVAATLDYGTDGLTINNDKKKFPVLTSFVMWNRGIKFLGELEHENHKTELYLLSGGYVPERFVHGVMRSAMEKKVSLCAPLIEQMKK